MLTDTQVFQTLETTLPAKTRTEVSRRMRRIPALWSVLRDEGFLKKAVSFAGNDPLRWRPGLLGLLAASETDFLRARFTKGGSSTKVSEDSLARADAALQKAASSGEIALDQAALAAIALWKNLGSKSPVLPANPPKLVWSCLYSIAPDSRKVVDRLAEMLPSFACTLLDVLMENEPPDRAAEVCESILPALDLSSSAALCESAAAAGETELARSIITAISSKTSKDPAVPETPEKRTLRARLLRLAGDAASALPAIESARQDARRLLLDTLMESARSAEAEKSFPSALSFWQEAAALAPNASGIRSGIARSLSGLGRDDDALAALPSSSDETEDLLLQAQILAKKGAREKAANFARLAFSKPSAASDLETCRQIAEILSDCGDRRAAIQVLSVASRSWPHNAALFSRLAELSAQNGDWHACAPAASCAWHLDPQDNHALRLLAKSADHEGSPKEAAEYYQILTDRLPDDPSLALALAQASFAAGDPARGRLVAERTLSMKPDCGEAHAILGLIDLAQGNEDAAFGSLQKATRLAPASTEPWKALSELHSAKGNREAAVTTLRAGIESASDPADLLLALGRTLAEDGRLREAAASLERALALHPEDLGILQALADASLGMQQRAQAEEYLNRSLSISPALLPAVQKLIPLLMVDGRFDEARTVLERAISADPQSPELHVELGAVLIDRYRKGPESDPSLAAAAHSVLQQADSLNGKNGDHRVRSLLGWAKIFTGDLPGAVAAFGGLLQAADGMTLEEKIDAHNGLAEALMRSGDFPTAVHNLQTALQLSSDDPTIRERLGDALGASGLHEDALEMYRKILSKSPENITALSGSASSLVALRRVAEAVSTLRQASELDPSNPDLPIRLAEIHLQSGDGEKARASLAHALQLDPSHSAGLSLRAGRVLCSLKEFAQAATVFEQALEKNPSFTALLTELGDVLYKERKFGQAFEVYRRASEIEPANVTHLCNAAEAIWSDGRKAASIAFLKKASQMEPHNASVLRRLGSALTAVGQNRDALPYYEQAMKFAPSDEELSLEAAQAAFHAGNLDQADLWSKSSGSIPSASPESRILKARIALEKGMTAQAVQECSVIVKAHSSDARGWALLAQALAVRRNRKPESGKDNNPEIESAEGALAKAAELCFESPESLALTADAAILLKDYAAAVRCLQSLCSCSPDNPDAHTQLAKSGILHAESLSLAALAGSGDPSASACLLSADAIRSALARGAALGASEDDVQPLYGRAALLFSPADPQSIESLEALDAEKPSVEMQMALAQAWLRSGNPERARKAAETAVNLDPEAADPRTVLGIFEWKNGRRESALAALGFASEFDPHSALPHAAAATILSELDRRAEAREELRRAVNLSPNTAAWQHTLGVWDEEAGDRSAALPCLQRASDLEPQNGEYQLHLARALLRDGDAHNALTHFHSAASLSSSIPSDLYGDLGKAAMESGQPGEAYQAFQSALEAAGPQAPFLWRLGKARAALALGRPEEARSIAKAVLAGEGHPPEARLILAEADEAEGKLQEAVRQLDRAASEMSNPTMPALRLARLWTATGMAARACAAMQTMVEADPNNDEAYHRLAEALAETNRLEEALHAGQKASEIAPRNADHWILLGQIARKMGQLDQSLAALAKAREISPQDWRPAMECGLTYEAEQRWDLALESHRSALKLSPENAQLHYRMGVVHKNLRAFSEAASDLRKAVQIDPKNLAAHKLLSGVMALSLVYGIQPQSADAR